MSNTDGSVWMDVITYYRHQIHQFDLSMSIPSGLQKRQEAAATEKDNGGKETTLLIKINRKKSLKDQFLYN